MIREYSSRSWFYHVIRRRSFCDELCQLYDVLYIRQGVKLYSIPNATSPYLSVIFTFSATEMKMTMVLSYSPVIIFPLVYRTLEIGTYEKSYRGLNLEDGQFFSITTERRQFRTRCDNI